MYKTLRVMHATKTEAVELASYHLEEVAYSWFELWKESREEGSPPARWNEFTDAFIDHFLPAETKAAHAVEFESLRQGSLTVWEYYMKFTHLSKYSIYMLPTMEARVRRFVQGLSPLVINEAATAALNSDMNYGKMVAFAQATEDRKLKRKRELDNNKKTRSTGNLSGSYSGGNSGKPLHRRVSSRHVQSIAQPSARPLPSGPDQQRWGHSNQGNHGANQQVQSNGDSQLQQRPPCPKCGRRHLGVCRRGTDECFGSEVKGHQLRHCPNSQGTTSKSLNPNIRIS
ncbi:uncharacterized protein [Nicotiana tomentosiformis]|uniref:uncharacterized protein n=1 Tax=Nicotiana tomentosiformis TaxID=4098 RepID=UPI00388CD72D